MKRVAVTIILLACCAIAQAQTPPTELSDRVDALANKMLWRPVAGISVYPQIELDKKQSILKLSWLRVWRLRL